MDKYVNDQNSSWLSSLKSLTWTWPCATLGRPAAGMQARCCACDREGARWGASPAEEGTRGSWHEEARRRSCRRATRWSSRQRVCGGVPCVRGRHWGRVKAVLHRAWGRVAQFTDGGSGGKGAAALISAWSRGTAAGDRRGWKVAADSGVEARRRVTSCDTLRGGGRWAQRCSPQRRDDKRGRRGARRRLTRGDGGGGFRQPVSVVRVLYLV
jgi:hypothetical protein